VSCSPAPAAAPIILYTSVAEPHHFHADPALSKNFDAVPAPTLLYSRSNFLKELRVNIRSDILFSSDYV
jgi:hypothetical protein